MVDGRRLLAEAPPVSIAHLLDHVADVFRLTESKGAYQETQKEYHLPEGGANLPCTFTRRDTAIGELPGGVRPVGDRSMYFDVGFDFQDRDVVKVKSGPTGFQGPQLLLVESFAVPRGHHVELRVTEYEGVLPELGGTSLTIEGAPSLIGKALLMTGTGAILFGTANDGQIYRSGDDGESFQLAVSLGAGIEIDQLLELESGTILAFVETEGVSWRSLNDGLSWSEGAGPAGTYPREDATVQLSSGRIVAGCDDGRVFTSDDDGASWDDRGQVGAASTIRSMEEASDGSVLCGTTEAGGGRIYRSTDGGATWAAASLPAGYPDAAEMGSVHSIILLASGELRATGGITNNVWGSSDDGATWTELVPGGSVPGQGGLNLTIYQVPTSGSLLTMGTSEGGKVRVRRSTDDGATWDPPQNDTTGATPDKHLDTSGSENGRQFLETQGGAVLACLTGDEPLFRSIDDGETWVNPTA